MPSERQYHDLLFSRCHYRAPGGGAMSWRISTKQYIPVKIGESFGGGYFAGYISHTANGNPTHALIVAPRATGATGVGYGGANLSWKTTATDTPNASSSFNGAANTAAIVAAGISSHPAAQFCVNLSIGGYTDWYLPARYELDIAYFNLKPGTTSNSILTQFWDPTPGTNIYAVPQRNNNWTSAYPTQTSITAFNTSTEAFVNFGHWGENGGTAGGIIVSFDNGAGDALNKMNGARVRAFRRISLSGYTT